MILSPYSFLKTVKLESSKKPYFIFLKDIPAEIKNILASVNGMGLGLYIAKKIIDDHKGRIWAELKGEGKGATFFVEFSVAE